MLKKYKVNFYVTQSPLKASIVERFNRTLKGKMYKYFTSSNSYKYIKALPKLIKSYNNTTHRSIKMKPALVNENNILHVWRELYKDHGSSKSIPDKVKFKVNDAVRISKEKGIFEKSYKFNWSHEIFFINKIIKRKRVVYLIRDLKDNLIKGGFYENELQRVTFDNNALYKIDKILSQRTRAGKREVLVQWKGWPIEYNSWVLETSLHQI